MDKRSVPSWQVALATVAALLAFAANSLLCRRALGQHLIDAGSFTAVRILSGALVLAAVVMWRRKRSAPRFAGSGLSGAALFGYAIAFSLAYHSLSAGVGALLLFGSVQGTMISAGIMRGERPRVLEWIGLVSALAGLVLLVVGRETNASLVGVLLMVGAGIAWGIYSLRGRGAPDPIAATAGNFMAAAPLAILAWLLLIPSLDITTTGLSLAVVSGAVTSGLGYIIWYVALPHLTATRAALVQLSVPILTAALAAVTLGEPLTLRWTLAAALVLGGIALAIAGRRRAS